MVFDKDAYQVIKWGKGIRPANGGSKISYLYAKKEKKSPSIYKKLFKMDHRFIKFLGESIGGNFSNLG